MRRFSGELLYCIAIFASTFDRRFLLRHSDIAVTYVTRSYGGTAEFAALAEKIVPVELFYFLSIAFSGRI